MPSERTCAECGQRLAEDADESLCPVCALRAITEENANGPALGPVSADPDQKPEPIGAGRSDVTPTLTRAFGDYELIEEIARGGMGVVYKARQKSLNRVVALKMVLGGPLASSAARQRFLAEARAAARLQHPNIVGIHEVGEHDHQPYFSMDYVAGCSLAEVLREGPLPAPRAAGYVKTIAEAVDYAHQKGILHRDLKPSNVLIDESDQPRVTDFGLAKQLTEESDLTMSGQVLGSPNFMAPEQAQGRHREVGPASDVYSLGALLYHLLTGRPPFQAATITEVLRQVTTTEPAEPRLLNPSIPRDLETICLKCLEKDSGRRYPTAQSLADELGRYLKGEPILARPLGPAGKAVKWCKRNPRLAAAMGVTCLAVVGGLAGVAWQGQRAETERDRAEAEALLSRRNAYAADMKEGQRALDDSDLGRARELLVRYWPQQKSKIQNPKSEVDLRGWEWRYLWSRCQSDESVTLCRYSNAVAAVSFSADGKWLAVRHEGGAVGLWDRTANKEQLQLPAQAWGPGVKALAFSLQTNLFVWSNQDANGTNEVYLAHPDRPHETASLVHPGPVRSLTFSPDGESLATMADDGAVRLWDLKSHRVTTSLAVAPFEFSVGRGNAWRGLSPHFASFTGWSDRYGWVLFSPDAQCVAVAELNHIKPQIRLFDLTTGSERQPIPIPTPGDGATALVFSPDSRLLAAGCGVEDTDIHIWELKTRSEVRLKGHSRWVAALAFSPDGKTLASGSADQTVRLWDLADHTEKRRFQGHTDEIWALAWSPDGKELVTGSKDGTVRCWKPETKQANASILPSAVLSWGLAFLPDSQGLLTLTMSNRTVVQWDVKQRRVVEELSFLGTNHTAMDLSPNGRWLALGDEAGNVEIWDLSARQIVTNLAVPGCQMSLVFFSPHGNLLCGAEAGDGDPRGKIWEVPSWQEISLEGIRLENCFQGILSPDDRFVATSYKSGGRVAWWDLKTRQLTASFENVHAGAVWVAFSPDGEFFATGGVNDGRLIILDTVTRRARRFGRVARNGVQYLAFSPDSQRLALGDMGPPGAVRLWDVVTGREVATLPCKFGFINHILFSPDGNTLLAASIEGTVMLWHAPSFVEIEEREGGRTSGKVTSSSK